MKISRLLRKKTPDTGFSEVTQLYLAAFAQLDTQFRWNYAASISRYLKQTLEENFSLLGAHSIEDWFGRDFVDLVSQFIWNISILAEKKGFSISSDFNITLYFSYISFFMMSV